MLASSILDLKHYALLINTGRKKCRYLLGFPWDPECQVDQ